MKVLMLKSKKGGPGKSLFSREFAIALSALGLNVALLDASEQANDDILENQQRNFSFTLKECLIDGVPLHHAARQVRKRLWLIAGTTDHDALNEYIRRNHCPTVLQDLVNDWRQDLKPSLPFEQRFSWWNQERIPLSLFQVEPTTEEEFNTPPESLDYLILDSDASTSDELTFALFEATDGILVPYEPTELDWQSYHQLKADLQRLYQRKPKRQPPIVGVLPNKVIHVKGSEAPLTYLTAIYRKATEPVYQPVHWSKIYGECLNRHEGSLEHPTGQTDRAVKEVCSILLQIIGYEGELSGLKFCEKCVDAFNKAQQLREVDDEQSI